MKKHLLLLTALTILSITSQSQVVSKGDKLLGGSVSLSLYNNSAGYPRNDYPAWSNVAFIPSFAWVIKKDVAIGVKGNLTYSKLTLNSSVDKMVETNWNLGPEFFYKKYKTIKDQFGIYFNHGIYGYYMLSRRKNTGTPDYFSKEKIWGGGYNFTPGVFYKFSSRFLGEANIGGAFGDYNVNANYKTFSAGVSFFKYFNFGINYIIGKKA